mmetsp:Transcript_53582/g.126011  ORF Transcript_53582/g.126011 Transcript_53582/m.126011 type:complete len:209 (+) Transcript_53582:1022-1648(+)
MATPPTAMVARRRAPSRRVGGHARPCRASPASARTAATPSERAQRCATTAGAPAVRAALPSLRGGSVSGAATPPPTHAPPDPTSLRPSRRLPRQLTPSHGRGSPRPTMAPTWSPTGCSTVPPRTPPGSTRPPSTSRGRRSRRSSCRPPRPTWRASRRPTPQGGASTAPSITPTTSPPSLRPLRQRARSSLSCLRTWGPQRRWRRRRPT